MSSTSDLCEFNISLFYHVNQEEFMLFVLNYNMTLAATGMLEMDAKIQYLRTLVHGEALSQFEFFSAYV